MHKRLMLSIAMLALGAGLLAATGTAGSSGSSASEAASGPAQKGGTFRVSLNTDIDYVDSALAYYVPSWGIEYATVALLMNYPDAPAPRGSRLQSGGLSGRAPHLEGREDVHVQPEEDRIASATGRGSRPSTTRPRSTAFSTRRWPRRLSRSSRTSSEGRRSSPVAPRRRRASRSCRRTGCRSASPSGRLICCRAWRCRSSHRSRPTCRSTPTVSALRSLVRVRTTSPAGSRSGRSRCCRTASTGVRGRTT